MLTKSHRSHIICFHTRMDGIFPVWGSKPCSDQFKLLGSANSLLISPFPILRFTYTSIRFCFILIIVYYAANFAPRTREHRLCGTVHFAANFWGCTFWQSGNYGRPDSNTLKWSSMSNLCASLSVIFSMLKKLQQKEHNPISERLASICRHFQLPLSEYIHTPIATETNEQCAQNTAKIQAKSICYNSCLYKLYGWKAQWKNDLPCNSKDILSSFLQKGKEFSLLHHLEFVENDRRLDFL